MTTKHISMPTSMELSAEMRRIKAAANAQGKDLGALSDAQAILHEMFPIVRTQITSYTATKSADEQQILYRLVYVTDVADPDTYVLDRVHTETREIILHDNPSSLTHTITYNQSC